LIGCGLATNPKIGYGIEMRALVVAPRLPPATRNADFGADKRLRMSVEALGTVFSEVDFLYLLPEAEIATAPLASLDVQRAWGLRGTSSCAALSQRSETFFNHYIAGLFSASGIKALFPYAGPGCVEGVRQAVTRRPDLIFTYQLQAMLPVVAARPQAPVLFDFDDMMHRIHWRTTLSAPPSKGRLMHLLHMPALLACERRAVRFATCTTVCADGEADVLARLGARRRAVTVPNALAMPPSAPPLPDATTLLFLGNYEYEPNVLAAERMVQRIWPLIRSARPDARLLLAGGSMHRLAVAMREAPGVEALGFVGDLGGLYAQTRIVVCPLDIGGGSRIKLIEAASYGRPMVSTRIGAENLDFRDGIEIALRDDDSGLAEACIALLGDHQACAAIGAAARDRAQSLYDVASVRQQIVDLIWAIIAKT
jgi:glycosyltransferase involved in cell wall biosynthesis